MSEEESRLRDRIEELEAALKKIGQWYQTNYTNDLDSPSRHPVAVIVRNVLREETVQMSEFSVSEDW